jgi:hypothetical protein
VISPGSVQLSVGVSNAVTLRDSYRPRVP